MGPVMGVTVPTLNVGMVFTSGCWYRDPHGLPWVEYHHTGAPKVWYGVPDSHGIAFYTAMKQLVPTFCRNKKIWLPADTAMVRERERERERHVATLTLPPSSRCLPTC